MTSLDMTDSIAPRSDQLNADDLIAGARTVTITRVTVGDNDDQPVNVHLAELDRPFKPSKSMRRVMVAAWGKDAGAYTGQRMTLYRDPEITFGRDKVGGIRISHMSGITKKLQVSLTVTRGKRAMFTVDPLPDAPKPEPLSNDTDAELDAAFAARNIDDAAEQLRGISTIVKRQVTARSQLTEAEGLQVVASLKSKGGAA